MSKASSINGRESPSIKKSKFNDEMLSNGHSAETKIAESAIKKSKIIEELISSARSESPIMKKSKLVEENDDLTKSKKIQSNNKEASSSQDDVVIIGNKIKIFKLNWFSISSISISDNDDKIRSKQYICLPLRSSPRLNKSKLSSNETPKKPSNGIHYIDDDHSNDEDSIKMSKIEGEKN